MISFLKNFRCELAIGPKIAKTNNVGTQALDMGNGRSKHTCLNENGVQKPLKVKGRRGDQIDYCDWRSNKSMKRRAEYRTYQLKNHF